VAVARGVDVLWSSTLVFGGMREEAVAHRSGWRWVVWQVRRPGAAATCAPPRWARHRETHAKSHSSSNGSRDANTSRARCQRYGGGA